ncbi:SDR family oxidoreductase [Kineosporia sp. NBRC 101731]|uniref:SDR family oxidoreductase n=1 Tax=Kineosporia sp. NBRC 101731 TaxID=3032199 RepID=UPI0024A1F56C|nr:SDR family oxidoreductase [Kineosporia sp. NBRC 101731]GLY32481.1 short-chain dehydrogenase [Kineosporia sp. NBRC 101731]
MGTLENKTALVTGSSRGIGRATALRLAAEGAVVAVHYASNGTAAKETLVAIESAGGKGFLVQAELGVPGDVDTLVTALTAGLVEHTGEARLDILVNNAGIMGGVKPEDLTGEIFDRLMAVNAKAPLFLTLKVLEFMPDGGRIVNIGTGLLRYANPEEIAYSMSKGALDQTSLHLARLLGPRNITVNTVSPGVTNNGTPIFEVPEAREFMANMTAFKRIGEPEDIADVVAFLASNDARWITGTFVDASGGTLLGG